jgi:hypothetical protein
VNATAPTTALSLRRCMVSFLRRTGRQREGA